MKLPSFINRRLNEGGASHIIIPMLVVVGVAAYGTYTLVTSHAAAALYPIALVKTSPATSTTQQEILKTIDPTSGVTKIYASAKGSQAYVAGGTYSPDHKYLAWFSYSPTHYSDNVIIRNLATGVKKTVLMPKNSHTNGGGTNIKWSSDSSKLAVVTITYNATQQRNIDTLWTFNPDGTGLKAVTTLASGEVASFAPSSDDKSIVYSTSGSTSDGVYSVTAGSNPVKVHAGSCSNVRSIPAVASVAYVCSTSISSTSGANIIYKSNPGSVNAVVLHKYVSKYATGALSYSVTDITPTQDGKNLAVLNTKFVQTASCTVTEQVQISTMPVAANAPLKAVYNGPVSAPRPACMGGMPGDIYSIQWSTDDTQLAFIPSTPHGGQASETLDVLAVSTGVVKQLDAGPVNGISW